VIVKPEMEECKLRNGLYRQGTLKQNGIKQVEPKIRFMRKVKNLR
jgi:hypothetical protein